MDTTLPRALLFLSLAIATHGQTIVVSTSRGSVTGFRVDYGSNMSSLYYGRADVFLGIPFVRPPIGELRFQVDQKFFNVFICLVLRNRNRWRLFPVRNR